MSNVDVEMYNIYIYLSAIYIPCIRSSRGCSNTEPFSRCVSLSLQYFYNKNPKTKLYIYNSITCTAHAVYTKSIFHNLYFVDFFVHRKRRDVLLSAYILFWFSDVFILRMNAAECRRQPMYRWRENLV